MKFDGSFVLCALGLAIILEGLPYFLWAEKMPSFLLLLSQKRPSTLRFIGLAALSLGLLLIFLGKHL